MNYEELTKAVQKELGISKNGALPISEFLVKKIIDEYKRTLWDESVDTVMSEKAGSKMDEKEPNIAVVRT